MPVVLQYTNKPDLLGDNVVMDNGDVFTDGILNPNAVVSVVDGITRVDVLGDGIINANSIPTLGDVRITREPGWQGSTGWRAELLEWAEGTTPNAIAIAVYLDPGGRNYSWTPGGMVWDAVTEYWVVSYRE